MSTGRVIRRNGKWAYVISLPYDEKKGYYPQKWKSGFETKKAAQESLQKALNDIEEFGVSSDSTLQKYLVEWLHKAIEPKCAPRTTEFYRFCANKITEFLGTIPLKNLKPNDIENMYQTLQQQVSSATVHSIHRTLRAALNRAVKWGYIRQSPMIRVDAPSLKIKRRDTLSVDQAIKILEWLHTHHPVSYVGTYLALFTGMRRGEIAGLMWSDIGWAASQIQVERSRQRVRKEEIVGSPKTIQSYRTIVVDSDVMHLLAIWLEKQKEHARLRNEQWSDNVYILRHVSGEMYDPNTLTHDLRKAQIKLDLPKVSFHDLRHTHATLLLEQGVPLKTVSERLGHSSIRLTGDVYAHVTDAMQQQAASAIQRAFQREPE